jgi:hypothetical protein
MICLLACPVCAEAAASPTSSLLVALFLAVPVVVTLVAIHVVRKADS